MLNTIIQFCKYATINDFIEFFGKDDAEQWFHVFHTIGFEAFIQTMWGGMQERFENYLVNRFMLLN